MNKLGPHSPPNCFYGPFLAQIAGDGPLQPSLSQRNSLLNPEPISASLALAWIHHVSGSGSRRCFLCAQVLSLPSSLSELPLSIYSGVFISDLFYPCSPLCGSGDRPSRSRYVATASFSSLD